MKLALPQKSEKLVISAMDSDPKLTQLFDSMVEAVQAGELSAGPHEALLEPKITATATGVRADLPDTREGFAPHRAYVFSVAPSQGTVLAELQKLLGNRAANQLVGDWGDRCDLNQKLPETQVALFLDSNNKARKGFRIGSRYPKGSKLYNSLWSRT